MELTPFFNDKTLKPKQKTEQLSRMLLERQLDLAELILFADSANDPVKATCIESIEFATQHEPQLMGAKEMDWVIGQLAAKAPRIKWESAKVITNTIGLHPEKVADAVMKLLDNTENDGTVVRWSVATALAAIMKMKTAINATLIPAVHSIMANEEKNSIKKIYLSVLKEV